ncbi:hypothetical protein [Eubacterium sp.]
MNLKKLKALKVVDIIVLIIAIALLAAGIYGCLFSVFVYDGSGSLNKSDVFIIYAVTLGVPSIVFLGLFFIIKSKIKKYNKLDD